MTKHPFYTCIQLVGLYKTLHVCTFYYTTVNAHRLGHTTVFMFLTFDWDSLFMFKVGKILVVALT